MSEWAAASFTAIIFLMLMNLNRDLYDQKANTFSRAIALVVGINWVAFISASIALGV